jgi:hypothetical protein
MARQTMGKEGAKFSSPSASPKAGTLVPKKSSKSVDPYAQPIGKKGMSAPDKDGAAHTIKATYMKQTDPAAGSTQANGRVMNPAIKRSVDSFGEGMSTSY